MKSLIPLAILVMLFGLARPGVAGVGETTKQIDARYGKPQTVLGEHGNYRNVGYGFRGFMVGVEFLSGISKREGFARPDHSKLSPNEIHELLALNARPGMTWKPLEGPKWNEILHPKQNERYWLRSDEKAIASLSNEGTFLMISDRNFRTPPAR